MDDQLLQIIGTSKASFLPLGDGRVQITIGDQQTEHQLKPIDQLYGKGVGRKVDPREEEYVPLFMGIEEAIQLFYRDNLSLSDGRVRLALEELARNPAAPSTDPLVQAVQLQLQLVLSLNDYSRDEVRAVCKRLIKSVDTFTREGGRQGYLEFVRKALRM